jgi:hypothetical protein
MSILILISIPISTFTRARLIAAALPIAIFAIAIGIADPSLCDKQEEEASLIFSHPGNTYWRCLAWRSNADSLVDSYLIGVGFGVPYHPLTSENWIASEMIQDEENVPLDAAASEVLYVRGQHSSLVNVFYRLGALGGITFLLMNIMLLVRLVLGARNSDALSRVCLVSCGLLVIAFWQISGNVGLESPRYFVNYVIAVALALVCVDAASDRPHRAQNNIARVQFQSGAHRGRLIQPSVARAYGYADRPCEDREE